MRKTKVAKVDLLSLVNSLSEEQLKALVKMKKSGGKKLAALQAKREKLAAELVKIDEQLADAGIGEIADAGKESPPAKRKVGRKPGRKPGRNAAPAAPKSAEGGKEKKAAKGKGKRKPRRARTGLSLAVRQAFDGDKSKRLRSAEILEVLPGLGFPVDDPAETRRKVASILATQKNNFQAVGPGLYKLIAKD